MGIPLAEELLLLAYDDSGNVHAGAPALDYGLAGALLLELTLAHRLDVVEQRVVVTSDQPIDDPVADAALSAIAVDNARRTPEEWVGRLSRTVRDEILDRLVAGNVLRREKDRVLWIFPRTRYPSTTGELPSAEAEVRRRLYAAVAGDGPVEPRTAVLCALVRALHLERTAVPGRPRREIRERLKIVAEAQPPPGDPVSRAVREMEAAVVAAITAVMVIAATAAST